MDANENKKSKTIENSHRFFDYAEWIGRVPSTKATDEYERRLAFWLVHMKQSKKGAGTCLWYEELLDEAAKHGIPEVFDVDSRTVKYYDTFAGQQIGPFKVLDKADIQSPYGQNLWICSDKEEKILKVSTFVLLRIKANPDYVNFVSKIREFSGKEIGPWKLLGIFGHENVNEIAWMCSRIRTKNGKVCHEVDKICLPSFKILARFFAVKNGKEVDPVVDASLGHGVEDMTAKKCNGWTVIGYSHKASNNECMWNCVCECGNFSKVAGGKLRNGSSKSCGCYRKKMAVQEEQEIPIPQAVTSA